MGLGLVDKPHLQRFKTKLDEYFVKKTDKATSEDFGVVRVDGTTITSNDGVISSTGGYTLPTASTDTLGGVKIDGDTITIDENGVISSNGGGSVLPFIITENENGGYDVTYPS